MKKAKRGASSRLPASPQRGWSGVQVVWGGREPRAKLERSSSGCPIAGHRLNALSLSCANSPPGYATTSPRTSTRAAALPGLITVILLGGIMTGWFTPTEAGVVAVAYILNVVIPALIRAT